MKRSKSIRLVLLGGLAGGALNGCSPQDDSPGAISAAQVYTNDHYIPGAGYYHAPYRAWFPMRYNGYDPFRRMYFHGGQWSESPHQSITNLSSPTPEAVQQVRAQRTDISRGGFGRTSGYHHIWS